MGNKWITKTEVERIKDTYAETERRDGKASILKTAAALHLSTVKVRRVLITEGLWSSKSSVEIGRCRDAGMSTAEIAAKLHMTEKNVQAYMPYEGGAYSEESKNAVDSRRSRDKARGKNNIDSQENIEETEAAEGMKGIQEMKNKESDAHHMMNYAVDYGKMVLLLDNACDTVNELPVVRVETIETVRAFEKELFEAWEQNHETVDYPDPFDYPLEAKTEEGKRRMEEYNRREAAAEAAAQRNRVNSPCYNFIYIDCAPEALDYASPGMPESDFWLYPELLDKAKTKTRKMKKLTYSQFIDRLSACVCGHYLNGSAYEKTLRTQVELKGENTVLVFVNFHLLCDRSGGKNSKYTSVGDMVGTVRQIWDSTGVPMLFLASDEFTKVMGKDDEGRKLSWRVSLARV